MDSLRFYRQVMNAGQILFTILRIFSAIGAVTILLCILALSFLPGGLVTVDVTAETKIRMNMRSLMGDAWDSSDEALREQLQAMLPDGKITEDGFETEQVGETESVENRGLAIAMIPTFVELILSFALFRFLSRAMEKAKEIPFHRDVATHLRSAGWLLLALGCIPALCAILISLLTQTSLAQGSFDLYLIFGGFLLWALGDLILFVGPRLSTPAETPTEENPNAF